MTDYLQSLVQQSGLPIAAPLSPPAATPKPKAGIDHIAVAAGGDLLEIQEYTSTDEHPTALAADSGVAPPSPTPAPAPVLGTPLPAASADPGPEFGSPTRNRDARETTVEERITIADGAPPPSRPPREPTSSDRSTDTDVSENPPSLPAESRRDAAPPNDLMQAVMKWIAAGPAPTIADAMIGPTIRKPSEAPAPAETQPAAREPEVEAPPTASVPARVIEIEDSTPPPPPAERPALPSRPASPPPPPAASRPPERAGGVQVSIGSLHIRVEAPPSPAGKTTRTTRPAEPARSAAPAARPTGLSKLRRHYILPH